MQEVEILEILKKRIHKKRIRHILEVANTAENIAKNIYKNNQGNTDEHIIMDEGLFVNKVRRAALLHDFAKDMSADELYNISNLIIDEWKIDEEELAITQILHAPVSAYLAKHELGIVDNEVLEAIRFHTIGSPEMGKLAQIIFIADFIEPGREFSNARKARIEMEEKGIEATIILICNFTIKYNIDWGRQVHPNTVLLRNAYLRRQT